MKVPKGQRTNAARGGGRIFLRGRTWWIEFWSRGRQLRESARTTDEDQALSHLRVRIADRERGLHLGPRSSEVTFANLEQMLLDDYRANERKSLASIGYRLQHLRRYFGDFSASEITPDSVTRFLAKRREASAATLHYEVAILKRMLNLAVRAGKLDSCPSLPTVIVRNARSGFFERAELEGVLAYLPEHLRSVAEFASLTGWRKSEVLGLKWRQVDFSVGIVRLEPGTTKNDEGRSFPFDALPELARVMSEQRRITSETERRLGRIVPHVFHEDGQAIGDFRKAWKAACLRAECPQRLFHDLRRTAVRNLERAGVSRSVAMKLTGHKTESVYRRYAIVSERDLAEGVGRLAGLIVRSSRTIPAQSIGLAATGSIDDGSQSVVNTEVRKSGGAVAQLGERLTGSQEVDGSIPFSSTIFSAASRRPPSFAGGRSHFRRPAPTSRH